MLTADTRPLVIYVEDDADTFRLAEIRLRSRYRLLGAANDREACELFRVHGAELYAVLMDIELAGSKLDGKDLIRVLRGQSYETMPSYALGVHPTKVPIVVMTAHSARYSEHELKEAGATHYVTKPIDFTRLTLALAQANIASVMNQLGTSRTSAQAMAPAVLESLRHRS